MRQQLCDALNLKLQFWQETIRGSDIVIENELNKSSQHRTQDYLEWVACMGRMVMLGAMLLR